MIQPGMVLQNRFAIGQRLGDGGFAETFDVSDRGTLKVLKVLKIPSIIDEDYRKAVSLFQREAEVLRHLHHPGIPRVEPDGYFTIKIENSSEPYHCLVMEKIEGQNLDEWLTDNGCLSGGRALDWLKQLSVILDNLHQQQFFHRDIKPANIMVKTDGQLVLIDFGAVREISNTYLAKLGSRKEVTGLISPGYTPLEQAYGKAVPQSDFFALGRTFVHLLTGKHPIDLDEDSTAGLLKWRSAIPRSGKRANPKLTKLADLIDALMAPFAGNRPKTVGEILHELAAIEGLDSRKTWISPLTTFNGEAWAAPVQFLRKKGGKIGAGIAIASLGLWIVSPQIALYFNKIGYQNMMEGELQKAELYLQASIFFDSQLGAGRYNLGLTCKRQKNYDCASTQYQIASFNSNPRIAAAAQNNLAHLKLFRDGDADRAIELLLSALKQAVETPVKSNIHKNLGWAYLLKADYDKAEEHLREAIALNRENGEAYCILATVLAKRGDRPNAQIQQQHCQKSDFEDEENWIEIASDRIQSN